MKVNIFDIWGSAGGPVTVLAPQTRLSAGFFLFLVCMIALPDTAAGLAFLSITVLVWLAACRVPWPFLRRILVFGLMMFLPFFLLTPWTGGDAPSSASWTEGPELRRAVAVPWRIFARGMGGMLVSVAAVSSVSTADFHAGISRLPLPRALAGLLMQIIHQAGVLIAETRRIAAAMVVRGAVGRMRGALRILASLPKVWLPRVMTRAERVATAMDLREFEPGIPCLRPVSMRRADWIVLLLAAAWLVLAAAFRIGARG
jgi:energy-coupling factor transporter transmembrane protein EcfT